MSEPILQAQIDAANAYEALFVPALFGQWAPKVADAARIQSGHRVLDVACGTGILAREIASRIGSVGRGWLPVMGIILTEEQIRHILEEAEQALSSYATADGRAEFQLSAHLVTAEKA